MASTDPEYAKEGRPPQAQAQIKSEYLKLHVSPSRVDVGLRVLLFAASLTSVVVIVTSKQTIHQGPRSIEAKFNHSPAFM